MSEQQVLHVTLVPFEGKACEVCGEPAYWTCPDFVLLPDADGVLRRYFLEPPHYHCLGHGRLPVEYTIGDEFIASELEAEAAQ